jgi:hypothetical protein
MATEIRNGKNTPKCKTFTVLLNRLKPYSENIIGEYHPRFRNARSIIDHYIQLNS